MIKSVCRTAFVIGMFVLAAPASAQQPSASKPAIPMFSASDNAQFVRVDEGIFEIQVGRTIDLTDKKLIFMLSRITDIETPSSARAQMTIAGNNFSLGLAERLNLKNAFSNDLRDYRNCWMDLIRVTDARGAPPSATFRMECR